jgi:hypothetical protein
LADGWERVKITVIVIVNRSKNKSSEGGFFRSNKIGILGQGIDTNK